MSAAPIVLVGGGLAAGTAARELRTRGDDGPLVLFAGEDHLADEPPLSKGYLLGKDSVESTFVNDAGWYAEHEVDLRLGVRVDALDVRARTLRAETEELEWSGLLIATGATLVASRSPTTAGFRFTICAPSRTRPRCAITWSRAPASGSWVAVGSGSRVGECGPAARAEVVVLEALDQPLLNVLGPEVGGLFARLHRERGVDLRTGVRLAANITSASDGPTIRLGDGDTLTVDHLVVGIRVTPTADLASKAGIAVDNGILVDAGLRTSAPCVPAAGDVANVDHPVLGRRLRVEHWDTAIKHGMVAAANLLGEVTRPPASCRTSSPTSTTSVWSTSAIPALMASTAWSSSVTRADRWSRRSYGLAGLRGDLVVAGMHVNDWDVIDQVRALVGTRPDESALRS